jgi:hypothetical protein
LFFFARDLRVLRSASPWVVSLRAIFWLALGVAAGLFAEQASRQNLFGLLAYAPYFWVAAAIHLLLALTRLSWLPSPAELIALTLAAWFALQRVNLPGAAIGAALGATLALPSLFTFWKGRRDPRPLSVALLTHLLILFFAPFWPQEAPAASAGPAPLSWTETLIPLALTAALTAASFAWHHSRGTPYPRRQS